MHKALPASVLNMNVYFFNTCRYFQHYTCVSPFEAIPGAQKPKVNRNYLRIFV